MPDGEASKPNDTFVLVHQETQVTFQQQTQELTHGEAHQSCYHPFIHSHNRPGNKKETLHPKSLLNSGGFTSQSRV